MPGIYDFLRDLAAIEHLPKSRTNGFPLENPIEKNMWNKTKNEIKWKETEIINKTYTRMLNWIQLFNISKRKWIRQSPQSKKHTFIILQFYFYFWNSDVLNLARWKQNKIKTKEKNLTEIINEKSNREEKTRYKRNIL